jgi:hypothetical protein
LHNLSWFKLPPQHYFESHLAHHPRCRLSWLAS